jgi:hypothetical protein
MQTNRISKERAKCAQSNKTCRQNEILYIFAIIRPEGRIVTFYCFCNELLFIIFRVFESRKSTVVFLRLFHNRLNEPIKRMYFKLPVHQSN